MRDVHKTWKENENKGIFKILSDAKNVLVLRWCVLFAFLLSVNIFFLWKNDSDDLDMCYVPVPNYV